MVGGTTSGFFGLGGEVMIDVRSARYYTYVECFDRPVILLKN